MHIEFKKIEMMNFMSFAEETFDFSACKGMNLVQGKNNDIPNAKNGAGKSNAFLSLLYVLFGQLQCKIKNENIANKYTKSKDMCLALSFDVDGKSYKIRRGLAKGKSSFLQLLEHQDGKEVDITKSTMPETQEFIEKDLLHCDATIFLRTILLTADQTYNFYMLKKADKKEFVEKMFDISVFEEMHKAIHKDNLALDKDIAACQSKMLVLSKNQEDYEHRKASYDESKALEAKNVQAEITSLEKKLEDAKSIGCKYNDDEAKKLEDDVEKLRDAQDADACKLRELESEKSRVELGIHKLEESMSSREKAISKHDVLLKQLCNDCKSIFMKHYSLDTMSKEVLEMSKKKLVLENAQCSIDEKIDEASRKSQASKEQIIKAREKLREVLEESTRASRAISMAEMSLEEAKRRLNKAKEGINPYDELVEKCKNDIKSESEKSKKLDEKSRYLRCAEDIVSQDTLRKFIIKDLVVLLNNKIKTYLTKLGARYYVKFDEDMDYEFITPSGTYEWSNFSAGERMRIMVATSFAFRDFMSIRNGLNSNILVLDEYFDSAIDTLCVESIISILKDYSRSQNQNIFVISHRPEVSPEMFDRTIVVEKTNNIAHINI